MTPAVKWEAADRAFSKGVEAYIEFGQECARLNDDGTTQQEIGNRYQMSQANVSQCLAVGSDGRISNTNNLPRSTYSLYLLTTLDDKGFEQLAKPDTTQADIKAYKEAQKPPKQPAPTPAPAAAPAQDTKTTGEAEVTKPRYSWINIAAEEGALPPSRNGNKQKEIKEQIFAIDPHAIESQDSDRTRAACKIVAAANGTTIEQTRDEIKTLSETAQQKLARLEATLTRQLDEQFDKRVREAAKAMVPEIVDRCEKAEWKAINEFRNYATRKQGIKPHLTLSDYRFLRQTIAPDRYPEEYREKLTKAAAIINQFDKYVEAFKEE